MPGLPYGQLNLDRGDRVRVYGLSGRLVAEGTYVGRTLVAVCIDLSSRLKRGSGRQDGLMVPTRWKTSYLMALHRFEKI